MHGARFLPCVCIWLVPSVNESNLPKSLFTTIRLVAFISLWDLQCWQMLLLTCTYNFVSKVPCSQQSCPQIHCDQSNVSTSCFSRRSERDGEWSERSTNMTVSRHARSVFLTHPTPWGRRGYFQRRRQINVNPASATPYSQE